MAFPREIPKSQEKLNGPETPQQHYINDLFLAIETDKSSFVPVVKEMPSGTFMVEAFKQCLNTNACAKYDEIKSGCSLV